jgi:hypothetical protein
MRLPFVVVVVLLLAGCGDSGNSSGIFSFYHSFGPTFPVANEGKAALYIVRDTAPADTPAITVTVDGQPLGGLVGKEYWRLNLLPRLYDLRAYGTNANKELIITVAPGQTRFLLAQPAPSGSAELLELSWEQGRRLVRQGQLMWNPPEYD